MKPRWIPLVLKHSHTLVLLAAVALLLYFTYSYLGAWAYGYSSDNALIGLMAKYIAEQGEHPIFVWYVGYQGIFMEGYLTALFFRLFGMNPVTLSLAATVYFYGALFLFYILAKRLFDRNIAALAVLLTVCSSPMVYANCMRALPNFSSICILGMLMLLIYQRIVDRVTIQNRLDGKSLLYTLFFGLTAGFALYTYVLSAYFLIAVGLCSFVIYIYQLQSWTGTLWWRHLLWPPLGVKNVLLRTALWLVFGAFIALIIVGAGLFISGTELGVVLAKGKRPVEPLHLLVGGLFLHVVFGYFVNVIRFQTAKRKRLIGGLTLLVGMVLGFSPSLYYWYVLGGRSAKGASVSGSMEQILARVDIGHENIRYMLNLSGDSWFTKFAAAVFLLSSVLFTLHFVRALRRIFGEKRSIAEINKGLVFFFLPLAIAVLFLLSRAVVDMGSGRYLVPFAFVIALMAATLLMRLWRCGIILKLVSSGTLMALLLFNTRGVMAPLASHQIAKNELDELVAALDNHQLAYAYGDYWAAYVVDFYTNERIVIEPTYSNYSPHYASRVKIQDRIGYITRLPKSLDRRQQFITIEGQQYQPQGAPTIVSGTWELTVLNKVVNPL